MTHRSMLDHFFSSPRPLFSLSSRIWNPPTDVYETPEATVIRMEVAGLDETGFEVIAQHNLLIVRGRRSHPMVDARSVSYHLMEIHYGEFERVFAFAFDLDRQAIRAVYERGFLMIEVRKTAPRVTSVQVRIVEGDDQP